MVQGQKKALSSKPSLVRKPSHQQLVAPASSVESDCEPKPNQENKQSPGDVRSKLSSIKLTHKLKRRQQIILNAKVEDPPDQSQWSHSSSLCSEVEQTSLKFLHKRNNSTIEEPSRDVTISDIRKNNGQLLSTDSNDEDEEEAQLWIRFENSGSSQFKQTNTEDWDIELSRTV